MDSGTRVLVVCVIGVAIFFFWGISMQWANHRRCIPVCSPHAPVGSLLQDRCICDLTKELIK